MAAECSWDLPQKKSRSSAKKASDRERDKTRVNIGAAFPRWRALRADKGLQLDSELALLLLDAYEKGCLASTPPKKTRCGVLPPEASNTDEVPSCDGLGAATDTKTDHLPVAAAADETIHELPENLGAPAEEKPPSDDVLLPADPHTVLMEGDIIGSRASIVYEEKLRQLATLVHLPMKRCPHTTPTGLQCQSFAPFQCIIQQRCTAFVVEWVCPRGHVVWSWTSQPTFKFGMLAGDFMLGMNILLSANSYTKVALLFRFMNMGVVSPVTFCKIQDTYCVDAIKPLWMQRRCEVVQRIQDEDVVVSVLPSDVQKVVVVKEEQQEWSSSLDQEDPEPPHIKEEQEELWSSQEGEQLQGLEEADITKFTFTPVPVKSEDDEEKPQSSQMETEADGEDCGGPQPDRNSDTDTEDKTGDSSETETDDSEDDWTETREPQSGLNSLKDDEVPVTDERCSADEKPFSCSECGNRFGRKTNLKKHMRIHMGEKPFSCTVCAKRFMETSHLKTHMRIHTGEKPFSCPVCDKKCLQKSHLKIHMITHSGEKPFSCSICNQSFTMSGSLQSHMKIHTGEKPFSCSVCDKRFLRNTHLKLHLRTHTGEKPYSCPFCDKKFSRKRPLTHHITVHTGNKLFSCSVCKKRFAWPEQVKRHKCAGHQSSQLHQTETNENREAEPPASSSTEQMKTEADGENCGGPEPDRNSHPDSHLQPVSEDDFLESSGPDDSDGEWEETREPQSGLKSEVTVGVINSVERPFSCSECDQSFDEEPHLVAHMTLHGGEKPFSCQFCDRTFAHKRHMKLHMSFHTDEKHFSCSACDKRFTWYTQLETHQCFGESSQLRQGKSRRRARAKEPFTCADCGKKFTLKGNLKTHMRIHTGEKPFSCSVCGRSFKQNVHLTEHMTIHTGEKLFKCSVCGKGFNRKSLVKNHLCV